MALIKKINIQLPFPPNYVNTYLVDTGSNKILFDTGAKTGNALNLLVNEINAFGGIDAVVLSHGHLDHAGLAKQISERYDVPIYASLSEKDRLSEDFSRRIERRVKKSIKALNFFGFSDEVAKRELEKINYYKELMEPLDFVFNFIQLKDSNISLIDLSGHTKGSIGLYLKSENAVITGDAFLKEGISSFLDVEYPENALKTYLLSLDKIIALKPEKVYPGHGNEFSNPEAVAAEHKEYVYHVSKKIQNAIIEGKKFSEFLSQIFPSNYNALIAMSEVIYALEDANIEILQNLKVLLSE